MTSGLVNVSFSLPEWKAVKVIFFAPWVRTFIFFDVWIETPWVLLPSLNPERSLCKMLKLKQIVPVQSSTKGVSCGWSHKRILTTHSKVRADMQDSIIHQAILIPGWSYARLTLSERSLDDSSSQKKTVVPTRWTYSGQCGLLAGNPRTCRALCFFSIFHYILQQIQAATNLILPPRNWRFYHRRIPFLSKTAKSL